VVNNNRPHFDFIILGAGFGGSLMSMVLRQLGHSVLLTEKSKHPRFVIGESSTPFANLLLEQISEQYSLGFLRPFCEWGSWQKSYPQIPAGIKRGFTFYHHKRGEELDWAERGKQLLVGASPNEKVADTHWYRPAFDQFLVEQAQKLGADYLDECSVTELKEEVHWKIECQRHATCYRFSGDFLIDASGANSYLAEQLKIAEVGFSNFPSTSAVYAHFRNVKGSPKQKGVPYPPDDAAVHHVFEGGWVWVLRFNNGITSGGAALNARVAKEIGLAAGAEREAWARLLSYYPTIQEIFNGATAVTPLRQVGQLSFRRSSVSGRNWALLPSAAGFVDPLLSTGFALTLLGISRLGEIFKGGQSDDAMREYERVTLGELDAAADLVSGMYAKMGSAEEFNLLSLIYFAALSYTESAHRLGKGNLAKNFLLNDNVGFRAGREKICGAAHEGKNISRAAVSEIIEPFNVAGLTDWGRNNWYPADFRDLLQNAAKLQATPGEVTAMLQRCGIGLE
jgi:FADH2 O2-dependent halogenase